MDPEEEAEQQAHLVKLLLEDMVEQVIFAPEVRQEIHRAEMVDPAVVVVLLVEHMQALGVQMVAMVELVTMVMDGLEADQVVQAKELLHVNLEKHLAHFMLVAAAVELQVVLQPQAQVALVEARAEMLIIVEAELLIQAEEAAEAIMVEDQAVLV